MTDAARTAQRPQMHGLRRGRHPLRVGRWGLHAHRSGDGGRLEGPSGGPGEALFVQISDTHIGFAKDANPDVSGTLNRAIDLVNGMAEQPALIIHTGDITHLSKPEEFDMAQQLLSRLRTSELHTTPGEHDIADATVSEYFQALRQGLAEPRLLQLRSCRRAFHLLDQRPELQGRSLASLGAEQLAWVTADLTARSSSTPIVLFAHMPLWTHL